MADSPHKIDPKSRYTEGRGIAAAYEGETVTRRRLMEGTALTMGGIATAAFFLPALGFALGPVFEDTDPEVWQDVGPESDFDDVQYVQRVITVGAAVGEVGKTTVYVRRSTPADRSPSDEGKEPLPYVAISTRCAHLGCPVRYIQASAKFVCPCHGGIYDDKGAVEGGPPVRPLDRFYTRVRNGRVEVGDRFSLNSKLERFSPRDPSNHLDGLWQYLYPSRPTT
ncbi:MAG TPA: ubiquinol-cytochrome c reductase iron-sulfur subunit [Thermoleophilaceae bacterium]|nr:ubiquinol-cytochrome c reductase iron-sulfur subunit [Thermoleophilaceae bacterium]